MALKRVGCLGEKELLVGYEVQGNGNGEKMFLMMEKKVEM